MRPIAYISRATLDSEWHWSPLDSEADSIDLSHETPSRLLLGTNFLVFSDHNAFKSIGKVGDHNT